MNEITLTLAEQVEQELAMTAGTLEGAVTRAEWPGKTAELAALIRRVQVLGDAYVLLRADL